MPQTILVVDDDRSIREFVRLVLEDAGYRVLSAADGREALELTQRVGRDVALVITDINMPVMDGDDLAERLLRQRPDRPVVRTTGGDVDDVAGSLPILRKPFTPDDLERLVARLLEPPAE
jgi:CheY-like chemotaxis protein